MAARAIVVRGLICCAILLPLFIALKLTAGVDWSWWWVLIPLWLPFAILLAILGGFAAMAAGIAIAAILAEIFERY